MVKRSISPRSRRGRASRRSPAAELGVAEAKTSCVVLPSAAASAEISMPQTSAVRTSWATASATGPAPVATSTATRCPRRHRSALIASSASSSLDARGTKTPSLTSMIESAKRVVAFDARDRLTVDPPRHHGRKPFLRRGVEHAVQESGCQFSAEHLGHQLLGIVAPEVAVPMVDRRRLVDLAYGFLDVLGDGCGGHGPRMVSARMIAARTMF